MTSSEVVINISQDIERRLANLISVAGEYTSRIYVVTSDKRINAKSLMGMMSLVSCTGDTLTITADGPDEKEAIKAISDYLNKEE